MQRTQPQTEDNETLAQILVALIAALIPFVLGLRAAVALSPRPNKHILLAKLDATIEELRAMSAQFPESVEPAPITPRIRHTWPRPLQGARRSTPHIRHTQPTPFRPQKPHAQAPPP